MMNREEPIACTLQAGDYQARMRWIGELNSASLKASHRDGLTLTLVYDAAALGEVRELVRKESECCAFLRFNLDDKPDGVRLSITAPQEAAVAAEAIFAEFTAATPSGQGAGRCGCC